MKYLPRYYAVILSKNPDVEGFMSLLKKHWVLSWLPQILKEYKALEAKRRGVLNVRVKTLYPLKNKDKEALRSILKEYAPHKEILFEEDMDKAIIGGLRLESDELLIRGSLLDKLTLLASNFS